MAYNPGTQYRGDAYLFTGISRAGEEVGRGLERRKQERAEFDALAKYAQAAGYGDRDQTTPMSLSELKGFVRGMEAKAIQDERKTDNDRQAKVADAQIQNFENDNARAAAAAKSEQERRGRTKDLYGKLASQAQQVGPNPDGSTQGDTTWEAIVNAAVEADFDGSPLELKQLADGIRMGKRNQEEGFKPRIVTVDYNGKQVPFAQTGPNASQLYAGDELTPGQKQGQIQALQRDRREFLKMLGDPMKPISDEYRMQYQDELGAIDQELEALGAPRRAPAKDGSGAKSQPAPAATPAKRFRLNATTGKLDPIQ